MGFGVGTLWETCPPEPAGSGPAWAFRVYGCEFRVEGLGLLSYSLPLPLPLSLSIPFSHSPVGRVSWVLYTTRKVDIRLPGKGNSNSHGARPVHLIIKMI